MTLTNLSNVWQESVLDSRSLLEMSKVRGAANVDLSNTHQSKLFITMLRTLLSANKSPIITLAAVADSPAQDLEISLDSDAFGWKFKLTVLNTEAKLDVMTDLAQWQMQASAKLLQNMLQLQILASDRAFHLRSAQECFNNGEPYTPKRSSESYQSCFDLNAMTIARAPENDLLASAVALCNAMKQGEAQLKSNCADEDLPAANELVKTLEATDGALDTTNKRRSDTQLSASKLRLERRRKLNNHLGRKV